MATSGTGAATCKLTEPDGTETLESALLIETGLRAYHSLEHFVHFVKGIRKWLTQVYRKLKRLNLVRWGLVTPGLPAVTRMIPALAEPARSWFELAHN